MAKKIDYMLVCNFSVGICVGVFAFIFPWILSRGVNPYTSPLHLQKIERFMGTGLGFAVWILTVLCIIGVCDYAICRAKKYSVRNALLNLFIGFATVFVVIMLLC